MKIEAGKRYRSQNGHEWIMLTKEAAFLLWPHMNMGTFVGIHQTNAQFPNWMPFDANGIYPAGDEDALPYTIAEEIPHVGCKLEVGKTYITNMGRLVTATRQYADPAFFCCHSLDEKEPTGMLWNKETGAFYTRSPPDNHPWSICGEYAATKQPVLPSYVKQNATFPWGGWVVRK